MKFDPANRRMLSAFAFAAMTTYCVAIGIAVVWILRMALIVWSP